MTIGGSTSLKVTSIGGFNWIPAPKKALHSKNQARIFPAAKSNSYVLATLIKRVGGACSLKLKKSNLILENERKLEKCN